MSDHSDAIVGSGSSTSSGVGGVGTDDSTSIQQQLNEYENQLSDINDLLELSPDDVTLQTLKSDMLELISITSQSLLTPTPATTTTSNKRPIGNDSTTETISFVDVLTDAAVTAAAAQQQVSDPNTVTNNDTTTTTLDSQQQHQKTNKKQKVIKKEIIKDHFEIPNHLLPNEADTENERNKKRRAIKGLKSKWNEKRKDIVSTQKQLAWQSFVNKKSTKNVTTTSIFSTTSSTTSKVGVVIAPTSSTTTSNNNNNNHNNKRHK
jgi:survival of motor neuron-related-splicing factor 30